MTHRTRYFLVASGLIVVVGLGTGLVAVYTGGLAGGRAASPAELAYISSDATAVAFADVRHIMDSQFRQRLRAVLPTGQGKERLLTETGIDIERDIDTVVAGLSPSIMSAGGPVVLLRGRFDESQIEAVALKHGATAEEYKGKRLFRAPAGRSGEATSQMEGRPAMEQGPHAVAFLEPGLVALGRAAAIRRAIDAAEGRDGVTSNAELMKVVADVASSSDAWIAGQPDEMSGHAGWPEAVKEHLSAVEWFAFSAGIDGTVTCRLRAGARDAESGEQLRAIVNGALAMARLMADKDDRLSGMLDSVQSRGTGAEMELTFTMPPEVLDVMTGSAGGGRFPAPPRPPAPPVPPAPMQ